MKLNSLVADAGRIAIPSSIADGDVDGVFRIPPKSGPRVVLLQGPAGPFFKYLQGFLSRNGYDAWRVTFNSGDRLFSSRSKRVAFRESKDAWSSWFRRFIAAADADCLVLFGAERELHAVARTHAEALGVNVISLEEGYIRPGFITIEQGANNWLSPIAGKLPAASFCESRRIVRTSDGSKAFRLMCAYGILYYVAATLFSSRRQKQMCHRQVRLLRDAFLWGRNYFRRIKHQPKNFSIIGKLLEHQVGSYFIVPLQMASDTQMGLAALGWNNTKLITETILSFATHSPKTSRLVFKIHPLERGHNNDGALIRQIARSAAIDDRVDIIDTGSIGLLTRHSAGMITINSTSGLSAIYHGVPLLVVGRAFYANDALATCAHGAPDFDAFWKGGHVADEVVRYRYLSWIKEMCLRPGDFYEYDGMQDACEAVLDFLKPAELGDSETVRAA